MMTKSEEFLTKLQNELLFKDKLLYAENQHLRNILELIKQNKFDDLKSYINNDYAYTANKNYAYRLRDKISAEIQHHINYIMEIENDG